MIKIVNFIVKYPPSILLLVFALYMCLEYVFSNIDKYLHIVHDKDIFVLGIFYLVFFILVSAVVELMLYSYILFLYQLKKVSKFFIILMLLNFLILICFLVEGYFSSHVDLQRYSVAMAFCKGILFAFAINAIYIVVVSWKNKFNMSYIGIIAVSEFMSLLLLDYLFAMLFSFSVSGFAVRVWFIVFEIIAHLIPALLFMYFARKLRKKRHEVN